MSIGHASSFRDLVVYRKARGVQRRVFELSKAFPKEEQYALPRQIRRSSRSIGAQIAEAWAKRRYENHFVSKLTDADAEQQEAQHWVETAQECEYLKHDEVAELMSDLFEIGRMLQSMIDKASRFCGQPPTMLREAPAEYFVPTTDHADH